MRVLDNLKEQAAGQASGRIGCRVFGGRWIGKNIIYYVLPALMLVSLAGCGSEASDNRSSGAWMSAFGDAINDEDVPRNGLAPFGNTDVLEYAADEPEIEDEPEGGDEPIPPSLSAGEARAIAQAWVDNHPFATRSELELGYSEVEINGEGYYRFDFGVVRLAVFDILVSKATGGLYVSGGNNAARIEPIDEWYDREHSGNVGQATGYEAEIIGKWLVADGYEWHDYFLGGEIIEFFEGGMGVESLDGSTWHFIWWAEAGLEMNYNADEPFEMHMISLIMVYEDYGLELRFHLYDNNGSILWDSKLNLDQGAGPPLVLERK